MVHLVIGTGTLTGISVLNYRAPALRGLDGQVISDVVTVPLGFLRFGTATGPADAAQE